MSKQPKKVNKSYLAGDQIISAALIGISVIAVLQLLTTQLDIPLKISLYCFAISIPLLCGYSLNVITCFEYEYYVDTWYDTLAMFIGSLAAFIGVAAIFWHFSRIAGALFLVLSVLSLKAWLAYADALDSANKK